MEEITSSAVGGAASRMRNRLTFWLMTFLLVFGHWVYSRPSEPKSWWLVRERLLPLRTLVYGGPFPTEAGCIGALAEVDKRGVPPHCVASNTNPGEFDLTSPHGHIREEDGDVR